MTSPAVTPAHKSSTETSRAGARHHPVVRITHWVSALALFIMAGSGLRIFNASPAFARKGERIGFWPWEGTPVPDYLTFGAWLGGARHWHFAMMWLLVANGLVYIAFLFLHGEWRTLRPVRGDVRDAIEMARFYLYLRPRHPHQGKHNALQKTTYVAMILCGVLAVTTGIAIWKPVTLGWLTGLMGGYAMARWWHFLVMLILALLTLVHVIMVFAVDPYAIRAMTTGGYDEDRFSPEARNARPFVHLLPAHPEQSAAPESAK